MSLALASIETAGVEHPQAEYARRTGDFIWFGRLYLRK